MLFLRKIIVGACIFLGILTTLTGLWLLIDLIQVTIEEVQRPGGSAFGLAIPVALTIIVFLLALGGLMIGSGLKSSRSNQWYLAARILMITWLIAASGFAILFIRDEALTRKNQLQSEQIEGAISESHTIETITPLNSNNQGFEFAIHTGNGVPNSYTLTTNISVDGKVFMKMSEDIKLDAGAQTIKKRVAFADLFRVCGTDPSFTKAYVCINNGSVDATVDVQTALVLKNNIVSPQRLAAERNEALLRLKVETTTVNNTVSVKKIFFLQ
jgi:hypothetical protein